MRTALTRRNVIAGAAAIPVAASVLAPASLLAHPANAPLDFMDPADNLYGLLKLMGDLSGARTFYYQPGRIYSSRVGELIRPILDYTGLTVREIRRQDNGDYVSRYRGWMLMQDLATGAVLDEWVNPISGRKQKVEHFVSEIGHQRFTPQGFERPKGFKGEFTWFDRPFVLPWEIMGDDVWAPYEQFSLYTDSNGNQRYEGAIHTYHGSLAALTDRSSSTAPSIMASQSESPWFPWMDLAGTEGHMILRSLGRKFNAASKIPKGLLSEFENRYPDGLTRPLPWDKA